MRSSVSTLVAARVFLALVLTNVVLMLETARPQRSATAKNPGDFSTNYPFAGRLHFCFPLT